MPWVMPASPPAVPSALEVIAGVTVEVGPSTFQEAVSPLTVRVTFPSSTILVAKQFPAWGIPTGSAPLPSPALLSLHQHLETSGNPGCCCCSDKQGCDLLGRAHPAPGNAAGFFGGSFRAPRFSLAQAAPEFMLGRAVPMQGSLHGLGTCPCCLNPVPLGPGSAVSTSVTFPRLLRNRSFSSVSFLTALPHFSLHFSPWGHFWLCPPNLGDAVSLLCCCGAEFFLLP